MRLVLNIDTTQVSIAAKRAKIKKKDYLEILKADASKAIEKRIEEESLKPSGELKIHPKIKQLKVLKDLPKDFDYKKELADALEEKYLK